MNKRETVQAFVDSIQQLDFEKAKFMLADDFAVPPRSVALPRSRSIPRPGLE